MQSPAITVAIPVFNGATFINAALDSVASQTFSDFEIVVVDDGSTDATRDLVAGYPDPRLRLVAQANGGPSAARNRALCEARAPLVAFLDADDAWCPRNLAVLRELSDRYPDAGLLGNAYREAPASSFAEVVARVTNDSPIDYRHIGDYFAAWAIGPSPFCTSSVMVRRELAISRGGYRTGYNRGEDVEFYVRLALAAPVAASSYVGAIYRRSAASLTASVVTSPDICMRSIRDLISRDCAPPDRVTSLWEMHHKMALANAMDCLVANEVEAARKFLDLSRETRLNRRRWLSIRALTAMPDELRRGLFTARNYWRAA